VFEKKILGRIFGPKRKELRVDWESYIMRTFIIYTFTKCYITEMIKSRRMSWIGHTACTEET
jgi:hypothetical protein